MAAFEACQRQPPRIFDTAIIHDFGNLAISETNRINTCETNNALCPAIRIRPELFGPLINQ
jgi:hypothetical protein